MTGAAEDPDRLAAGLLMVGFAGTSVPPETQELIERGVRSFVLFAGNIRSADQTRALTAELRSLAGDDALIAIDQEGGRVNRLRSIATPWPAPMAWCATGDLALAQAASRAVAQELVSLGINLNLAPVADILSDHRNPVLGNRCYSDDAQTTADFVSAHISGHGEVGVGTTAKHFPGHGGTSIDSHTDLPEVRHGEEQLRQADLIPFWRACEAGVDCLMASHVWYAGIDPEPTPATVSPRVYRLARSALRFEGPIVTDCMEMGAIQRRITTQAAVPGAIAAGADLVTLSHRDDVQRDALTALAAAIRSDRVPAARAREAARRLGRLRRRRAPALCDPPRGSEHLADEIARRAVTLVRDDRDWLPLSPAPGDAIGVVTFPATAGAAEDPIAGNPLAQAVSRRRSLVPIRSREDAGANAVVDAAGAVQALIVGTSFATGRPFQAAVVNALLRAGKRVVVIALRDPFDLLSMPSVPCYLASYDETPISVEAAVAIVFGEREPCGRLPVDLPGLHARGYGLVGHQQYRETPPESPR